MNRLEQGIAKSTSVRIVKCANGAAMRVAGSVYGGHLAIGEARHLNKIMATDSTWFCDCRISRVALESTNSKTKPLEAAMDTHERSDIVTESSCLAEKCGDKILDITRAQLTTARYGAAERIIIYAGRIAMLVAALSGLTFGIVNGIKADQLSPVMEGVALVLIVMILQYVAVKFLDAGPGLLKSSPSELSSETFLSCVALIAFLGGIVALIGGTVHSIRESLWAPFGWGAAIFLVCEVIVSLCLNPSMLNINIISATSAGQEAIGVMTLFIKAMIRVVPVVYGVSAILGASAMIWAVIQLLRDNYGFEFYTSARTMVAVAGLWPIAAYLIFIMTYLGIDIIRAILVVPGKLDTLRREH